MQRQCVVCKCGTTIESPGSSRSSSLGSSPSSSPGLYPRSRNTSPSLLETYHGSASPTRVSPAIVRILCNKCNPKPEDYAYEPLISRKVQPPRSGIRRSVSAGEPVQHSNNDRVILSVSAESVRVSNRRSLFNSLATIQDTV